jgi:tRNA threonylcarbamoyladenosine biosynthesis protein TsaB
MPPILLALDTATRRATVAITDGRRLLAEGQREVTTHSEGLLPLIDELLGEAGLAPAALGAVVCGRGPGSFTGLRIGLATAKGLCLAAGVPLVCGSSLAPLAAAAGAGARQAVVAVLDARRGEVYAAVFRGGRQQGEDFLASPEGLVLALDRQHAPGDEPLVLAGDGALAYQELLLSGLGPRARLGADHVIEARHLAWAALSRVEAGDFDDLDEAVPRYIRPSDARLPTPAIAR